MPTLLSGRLDVSSRIWMLVHSSMEVEFTGSKGATSVQ